MDGLSGNDLDGEDRSGGIYEWDEGTIDQYGNSPVEIYGPGKLHKKTSQCAVFGAMLGDSFDNQDISGNPIRENVSLITNKGILWLPYFNNSSSHGRLDYYKYRKDSDGKRSVLFNGQWLKVQGVIHTHPNGYQDGPSISSYGSPDDFSVVTYFSGPNFVINPKYQIYKGVFVNGVKTSTLIVNAINFDDCNYDIYTLL